MAQTLALGIIVLLCVPLALAAAWWVNRMAPELTRFMVAEPRRPVLSRAARRSGCRRDSSSGHPHGPARNVVDEDVFAELLRVSVEGAPAVEPGHPVDELGERP